MQKSICHIVLFISIFSSAWVKAQISAQGQGGKDVVWLAVGIEQQIGKHWTNKNTIAYSRHSSLSNWNAVEQAGIVTIREELEYRLSQHFKFSQGIFYAERGYYDGEHPAYVNEIRVYPKVYHEFAVKQIKFSQYLRTDVRFFSAPGFNAYNKPLEIRNRYLMKATVPLDRENKNYLVAMTEFFCATDKKVEKDGSAHFTSYNFTENRSSLYLRHYISKLHAFLDTGVMLQTWKDNSVGRFRETYLLQIDLVILNPFSRKK